MPAITLAKALKLKNRLTGRLNQVQCDIQTYNSVLKEQANKVDVPALAKRRDEIQESLIGLKTRISVANAKIQENLIRMGEYKSKLAFLGSIHVRDGEERHGYQNTPIVWVAAITKADIDSEKLRLETTIDRLQDEVDVYNHTATVEIPQSYLDLAS